MRRSPFYLVRPVLFFIGSVVGAGIFALPRALSASGFFPGILLLVGIGAVLLLTQLMYADLVEQTAGTHRVPGYVGVYLGTKARFVALVIVWSSLLTSLSAYVLMVGQLLHDISYFQGIAPIVLSLGFGCSMAVFLTIPIQRLSKIHAPIVASSLILFFVLLLLSFQKVDLAHIYSFSMPHFFTPYGVALFALSGFSIAPELKEILEKKDRPQLFRLTMLFGMGCVLFLYLLFSYVIIGVSPSVGVPENALHVFTSSSIVGGRLAILAGILTLTSIYLMVGSQLKDTLRVDAHVSPWSAWALASLVPIFVALLIPSVIGLMDFAGTVFSGCISILLVLSYEKLRYQTCRIGKPCARIPRVFTYLTAGIFLFAILIKYF